MPGGNGFMRLLNPGPVTLTERVRRAMLRPDLCHREPEFSELLGDIRSRLARVYPEAADQYTAVVLAGSGTAAVEAMVGSLVPRGGKALVVANGVYGERIASILETQGKPLEMIRSAWTEPIDLDAAAAALDRDPTITHVAAVHHETTTGRLNDVAALGRLCRERGVGLLLDAVSSFGGERVDPEAWNLEACAATANKCLHGVPGLAFVLVRRDVLESGTSAAPGLYLDLFRHYAAQSAGHPVFTPAVHAAYALAEALAELDESGGWHARRAHYRRLSGRLRAGLVSQGFRLLLGDAAVYSASLTSFDLPEGVDFDALHARMKRSGFVIYPGQQALCGSIFRVAVMGALTAEDIEEFLKVT